MILPGTDRWAPGIGDPSPQGWFTVFAYLAVAVACGWNAHRARHTPTERGIWIFLTGLMVLLSINKQLDLQSWFTMVGRDMARAQGWYGRRAEVQVAFIAALVVAAIACLVLLRYLLRENWRRYALVLTGLALLLAWIVVRASTFHHVDRLLGVDLGLLSFNHVMELGSLAVVFAGAWIWRPPQPG